MPRLFLTFAMILASIAALPFFVPVKRLLNVVEYHSDEVVRRLNRYAARVDGATRLPETGFCQ